MQIKFIYHLRTKAAACTECRCLFSDRFPPKIEKTGKSKFLGKKWLKFLPDPFR